MLRKRDIVLLCILFAVGVVVTAFLYLPKKENGTNVNVRVNGTITATLPLMKNTTYTIKTSEHGENVLQIKDGVASIIEANCKDHICSKTEGISKVGQSIVCLPHKVSIEITNSGTSSDEPDAIAR